jgi:hypothetical protein
MAGYVRIYCEPTRLKIAEVGTDVRYEDKIGLTVESDDEQVILKRGGSEVFKAYFYNFLVPKYNVDHHSVKELVCWIQDCIDDVPENIEGHTEIVKEAGENINGGRAVVVENDLVLLFNPLDTAHYARIVGISKNSVLIGEDVNIVMIGIVTGLGGLTKDEPVYAVLNGELSNVPISLGISQIVGIALSENELLINQRIPIKKI